MATKIFSSSRAVISELKSGLRVVSGYRGAPIGCISVLIKSGSRYTVLFPQGITQFIKRVAFCATESHRNKDEFEQYTNSLGSSLTCNYHRDVGIYTAKFYRNNPEEIMKVLSDSIFRPQLSDEEIELQRKTLITETRMMDYNVDFDQQFMQHIYASAFKGNTLGLFDWPSTDSIYQISRDSLYSYYRQYYNPSRMTIVGVNIDHDRLINLVEEHFDSQVKPIWGDFTKPSDESTPQYTGGISHHDDRSPRKQPGHVVLPELVYVGLGFQGFPDDSQKVFPLAVLYSLLGCGKSFSVGGPGKGMYNRVNLNIMNMHIGVNSCDTFVQSYEDAGIFSIYGSCDYHYVKKLVHAILKELYGVINNPLGEMELQKAKNQVLSQLLMNLENIDLSSEDMGRQAISRLAYKPFEEIIELVNKVTASDVKSVLEEIMSSNLSYSAMGNLKNLPSYEELQVAISEKKNIGGSWF